jgi:hypothetical protein
VNYPTVVGRGIYTLIVSLLFVALGALTPAHAVVYSLADDNSTVSIDVDSQHGMFDWVIDGVNLLPTNGGGINDYRQWFWYRIGNAPEASVDTLTRGLTGVSDVNFDGFNETLFVRYTNDLLKIEIKLTLDGGSLGSGHSDIAEQITLFNTSGSSLDVSFFQYGDFQLCLTNENVTFPDTHSVLEQGSIGKVLETVLVPIASHREGLPFSTTITKLNNGVADDLIDNAGGTGLRMTWANQWDFSLASGGSALISKDKLAIIPEPSAVMLVLAGLLGLGVGLRRRR